MRETRITLPELALVAGTRGALGAGLGLLLANRLSEEQRRVILLIGLEGTSYQEAATILDVPVGTIRSRAFHGRESLRKLRDRRPESESASGVAIPSGVSKGRRLAPQGQPTQNFSRAST